MKTIANIMLVLNEAEFVEKAINSVLSGVDQLIVIDQGSTDGTRRILDDMGVVWVDTRGHNFLTRGEQFFRNLAADLCFCDWLMVTDADEILSDGWQDIVRPFLETHGDRYGLINIDYWQMVGSSEYHTEDSPLPNERTFLLRNHPNLHYGPSGNGTLCHCSAVDSISPRGVYRLPSEVACFHMGYAKSNLTERFNRNIARGDWTKDEAIKAEFYKQVAADPLACLPGCVPLKIPKERLPKSIRDPKFKCDYDPVGKRILKRF